jgi:hypothetical protein
MNGRGTSNAFWTVRIRRSSPVAAWQAPGKNRVNGMIRHETHRRQRISEIAVHADQPFTAFARGRVVVRVRGVLLPARDLAVLLSPPRPDFGISPLFSRRVVQYSQARAMGRGCS